MKIYTESPLNNFEFWAGAKDTIKYLTESELDIIAECLGYSDFEELIAFWSFFNITFFNYFLSIFEHIYKLLIY